MRRRMATGARARSSGIRSVGPPPDGHDEGRDDEQRDRGREAESPDHGDGERALQLAPRAQPESEGEEPEQGAQRRHENGTKTRASGFTDRDLQRRAMETHAQMGEVEQE